MELGPQSVKSQTVSKVAGVDGGAESTARTDAVLFGW